MTWLINGTEVFDEADLEARIRALRSAGAGISPCWDLLLMGDQRIDAIARALERES